MDSAKGPDAHVPHIWTRSLSILHRTQELLPGRNIYISLSLYIYLYLYKRIDIYMDPTSPTPIDLPSIKPKEFIKDQAVEPQELDSGEDFFASI